MHPQIVAPASCNITPWRESRMLPLMIKDRGHGRPLVEIPRVKLVISGECQQTIGIVRRKLNIFDGCVMPQWISDRFARLLASDLNYRPCNRDEVAITSEL